MNSKVEIYFRIGFKKKKHPKGQPSPREGPTPEANPCPKEGTANPNPKKEGPTRTARRKCQPSHQEKEGPTQQEGPTPNPKRKGQPQPKGPTPTRRANPCLLFPSTIINIKIWILFVIIYCDHGKLANHKPKTAGPTPPQEVEGPRKNPKRNGQPQPEGPTAVFFFPPPSENCHCVIVIKKNLPHKAGQPLTPRRKGQPQPKEGRANPDPKISEKEGPTQEREGLIYNHNQKKKK